LFVTGVVAAIAGGLAGWQGLISGLLGGLINVSAGVVFAVLARTGGPPTATGTIRAMVRAEAGKITLILLQLSLALALYRDMVHGAFFGAFVATLLVTQVAILFRD
jgi:F0F1-type ATP synthase assembly protein I